MLVFVLFAGLLSCLRMEENTTPDVSDIVVDLELRRFEQELFRLDTNHLYEGLVGLKERYPVFSDLYFGELLGAKGSPEEQVAYIKGFISFPEVQRLYDTCMVLYEDLSGLEAELEQAFRYYKYYFPEKPTPQVTTYLSEYAVGAFIYGEDQLALGLDFFLGKDYPYTKYNPGNPNFSNYLIRTFNREHMSSKALKPLVEDLVGMPTGGQMLDIMINKGKQLYLRKLLFPARPDSILLEMQAGEVAWLEANELEVWAYLLKEDLLYNSKWTDIRKFVEYSPKVDAMHPEAPGRTANWMGWQIVKAYMKNVPNASLEALLAEKDAQRILNLSKYKPPR